MRRVLLTRPEPGASATARRLAELGFEPVLLPLTQTRPLPVADIPDAARFDAIVATSTAAIRHAPPRLLREACALPVFAVGERTADAASRAGFARVESGGGDAAALARHIARAMRPGSRLLYLCGRLRTGALAERLELAGFPVQVIEVYETTARDRPEEAARSVLDGRAIDAALVYSAYGAAMLSQIAAEPRIAALLGRARVLCISARAAESLAQNLRLRSEIAESPDEAALLGLLGAGG